MKAEWDAVFDQTVGNAARQALAFSEDQWSGSVRDLHGRVRTQWIETQIKLQESLAQLRRLMDTTVFQPHHYRHHADATEDVMGSGESGGEQQ